MILDCQSTAPDSPKGRCHPELSYRPKSYCHPERSEGSAVVLRSTSETPHRVGRIRFVTHPFRIICEECILRFADETSNTSQPIPSHNALPLLSYRRSLGVIGMIELGMLEDMFLGMRAKTKWNVDGPMLWGYFFTDRSAEKLEKVATILVGQGYRFVEIREDEDGIKRWLHVERVEVHSPQSLFARNEALYKLADELGLDNYDGMDVGPVAS